MAILTVEKLIEMYRLWVVLILIYEVFIYKFYIIKFIYIIQYICICVIKCIHTYVR